MKKLLTFLSIFLISIAAFAQSRSTVFTVPDATTAFGIGLKANTLVLQEDTNTIYQITAFADDTKTLTTSTTSPVGSVPAEVLEFDSTVPTALIGGVKVTDAGGTGAGAPFTTIGANSISILSGADDVTNNASAQGAIGIGEDITASGVGSVALGGDSSQGAQATGAGAIAAGGDNGVDASATATAPNAIAVGSGCDVAGTNSVGVGKNVDITAIADFAVVMGGLSEAKSKTALALGYYAKVDTASTGGIAVGSQDNTGIGAKVVSSEYGIAIGSASAADLAALVDTSANGIAIGQGAIVDTAANAIQFGVGTNSVANSMKFDGAGGLYLPNGGVNLGTSAAQTYSAGQISYDPTSKTILADTGYTDVRVNIGQEIAVPFLNDTGVTIDNGKVINTNGTDATTGEFYGVLADNSSPGTSFSVIGIATADVLDGEIGLATSIGKVRDFDTSGLSLMGPVYLGTNGDMTMTRPTFPDSIVIMGAANKLGVTDGIFSANIVRFSRNDVSKSYSFTSQGITAGTYYKSGFYDWATTDANLTQAALTQTYGTVGQAYAAHAGIVPLAAGTVDTGVVGLRVTGIKDSETGVQVAAQTGIITEDITTLTANVMAETSEKFSGQVTFELYVVSGSPTAYSLDFNYGYSKYEDFQNRDVTITELECVWQGNATDANFDIALKLHNPIGWTYDATGFLPGNGDVIRKSVDQALAGSVVNNLSGAYKRISLDQFVDGNGSEGVLIEVITGANNTIQTMDMHISAVSEELTF